MKLAIFSLFVFVANLTLWFLEWRIVVGFSSFRHEPLLAVGFVGFLVVSIFQFIGDVIAMVDGEPVGASEDRRARLEIVVSVGASLLLVLSILASLPIVRADSPLLVQARFQWAALLAFLWVVFGIFFAVAVEADSRSFAVRLGGYIQRFKFAALAQSLGWSGTAVIMLIYFHHGTPR